MDEKLKSENMEEQFCLFMLYFESNRGTQE